jgi:hypothetical protein
LPNRPNRAQPGKLVKQEQNGRGLFVRAALKMFEKLVDHQRDQRFPLSRKKLWLRGIKYNCNISIWRFFGFFKNAHFELYLV